MAAAKSKTDDPEAAREERIQAQKDDPNGDNNAGWTAQSETAYEPTEEVPGQTVTEEELPDRDGLKASGVEDPDAYLAGVHVEGAGDSKSAPKTVAKDDKK